MDSLQTESRLRHMERFFQERGQYGASELMRPTGPESVCPETRERQRMENDLYIVTRQLKRKPLSLKDMKDFQAWKLNLMEAWAAMCLPIASNKQVRHRCKGYGCRPTP